MEFADVLALPYPDQAKFFLNAFWPELSDRAEEVWNFNNNIVALDHEHGANGKSLDEFKSHMYLEKFELTHTACDLRDVLRAINSENTKRLTLVEFLLFNYEQTIAEMMKRPQAMNDLLKKAELALVAVQKEIDAIEARKAELMKAAEGSGVRAHAAKNELEQLYSADQLPLNQALITAEAAVRRAAREGDQSAAGSIWWQTRTLEEAKKYKPRGGVKSFDC